MMVRSETRDFRQRCHQQQQTSVGQRTMMVTTSRKHDKRLRRFAGQNVARKYQRAAIRQAEYRRLKAIIPSVADKKSVSKVDH